jgi:hypothetical protein
VSRRETGAFRVFYRATNTQQWLPISALSQTDATHLSSLAIVLYADALAAVNQVGDVTKFAGPMDPLSELTPVTAQVFLPSDISGKVFWVRGDLGISLNGGTVQQWSDQVGGDSNKNLVEATAANQPAYNAADANLNGQPSLTFTTAPRRLISGVWAAPLAQPSTWFIVARSGAAAAIRMLMDGPAGGKNSIFLSAAHLLGINAGTGDVSGAVNLASTSMIVCVIFNGGNSVAYVNSISTSQLIGNPGANSLTRLFLGIQNNSTSSSWNAQIAEVFAMTGAASIDVRTAFMQYAATRYAIALT